MPRPNNMQPKGRALPKGEASKAMKRLFKYIMKEYKFSCLFVLILIIVGSVANIAGNMFLKTLIDDYILPFINQTSPNFAPLARAILIMAAVYVVGVLSTWLYKRIMINVTQGTLRNLRDDMFDTYGVSANPLF